MSAAALAVCWPSAQVGMPPELRGRVAGEDGSMANFGEDERFRSRMFEGNNKVRFERPVDEASRRWWLEKFYDTFGLTPEDMQIASAEAPPVTNRRCTIPSTDRERHSRCGL